MERQSQHNSKGICRQDAKDAKQLKAAVSEIGRSLFSVISAAKQDFSWRSWRLGGKKAVSS
jgi:hypothetical protein